MKTPAEVAAEATLLNHAARLLDDDDTSVQDDLRATAAALRGACPSSGSPSSLPRRPVADAKVCPDCGRAKCCTAKTRKRCQMIGGQCHGGGGCAEVALARERTAHEETRRALEAVIGDQCFVSVGKSKGDGCRSVCRECGGFAEEDDYRSVTHLAECPIAAALGPQKPAAALALEWSFDGVWNSCAGVGGVTFNTYRRLDVSGHEVALGWSVPGSLEIAQQQLISAARAAGLLPEAAPQDKEEP